MDFLRENKDWIFDGIGVVVITGIAAKIWSFFSGKNDQPEDVNENKISNNFSQTSGDNSKNYQAHTMHINDKGEE